MARWHGSTAVRHLPVWLGAAALLSAIVLQLGMYPVFHLQRKAVRHAMKDRILAGVPASALTEFRYTPQELAEVDFLDGGRELRHEGVMYDIARVHHDGHGHVVIAALRDDKETRLMADLGRMVELQVEQDATGRNGRLALIGSWAVYCEPWSSMGCADLEGHALTFFEPAMRPGRLVDAMDPGPPRRG